MELTKISCNLANRIRILSLLDCSLDKESMNSKQLWDFFRYEASD